MGFILMVFAAEALNNVDTSLSAIPDSGKEIVEAQATYKVEKDALSTSISFDELQIRGELRTPNEFFFQKRNSEEFGNLVSAIPDFRTRMIQDLRKTR